MIRQLRPGERIPEAPPRRYLSSHGYVRLRWKVGKASYVEVYEHRVFDGRVTAAAHVHHRNGVKSDNRTENLEPVTTAEHAAHHRAVDRDQVVRLYLSGLSMPRVAQAVGADHGYISRILRAEGVRARRKRDYAPHVARDALVAAAADETVTRARDLAERFDVPLPTIYRLMREYGIPPFDPSRRKRKAA